MKPENMEKVQNAFIALFAGLVIPPAIGFGFGYWVLKETSDRRVNEAVLTTQANICVAQFTSAADYQARFKEYKALDYSARTAFFEKGNWGRMPGEEKARSAVIESCASKLENLAQK